jgi:hypothetical protein
MCFCKTISSLKLHHSRNGSRDGSLDRGDPWGAKSVCKEQVSVVLELHAQLNTVLHTY